MRRLLVLWLLVSLVTGCSFFRDKSLDSTRPAALKGIKEEIRLKSAWNRNIGGSAEDPDSRLVPAIIGNRVFAAAADGTVMAMEATNGRVIWKLEIKDFYPDSEHATAFAGGADLITGGIGAGGDLLIVATFAGELVAMNQSDGSLAWRARVTSEVLSPPQVEGGLVVAQSIDGRLAAFDVLDGARRWLYSTSIPSLTLRGSSTPIINGDVVIAGFANGRVSILDRQRGLVHLDRRVGVSQGKSDLDRLVDIDGPMVLSGGTLYVVSYQGSLMSLDVATGRVNWAQDASSTAGVGMGFGTVYVAESNGRVVAIDAGNGKLLWETAALKFRELTTPAVIRSYVALGDLDGYVHLIAQADGRFVGREKVTRGALKSPMVVDESRLYIMTESGKLLVYELR